MAQLYRCKGTMRNSASSRGISRRTLNKSRKQSRCVAETPVGSEHPPGRLQAGDHKESVSLLTRSQPCAGSKCLSLRFLGRGSGVCSLLLGCAPGGSSNPAVVSWVPFCAERCCSSLWRSCRRRKQMSRTCWQRWTWYSLEGPLCQPRGSWAG